MPSLTLQAARVTDPTAALGFVGTDPEPVKKLGLPFWTQMVAKYTTNPRVCCNLSDSILRDKCLIGTSVLGCATV